MTGPAAGTRGRVLRPEQVADRVERELARSAADETEIVWLELRRGRADLHRGTIETALHPERTVLVRVIEGGRRGSYRTGGGDDLQNAIRQALAQARVHEPLPGLPHLPTDDAELPDLPPLLCPRLASLDEAGAHRLLADLQTRAARVVLDWTCGSMGVFNHRGLRRTVEASAAQLEVRHGRRPGAGRAIGAARTLEDLAPEAILARAAERHADGEAAEPPKTIDAALLSPEAAIVLTDLLNREALSAASYSEGGSILREHLGVQVFDRSIDLRDDARDPAGLPFPFDFEGTAKRPIALIEKGTPRTPALDQRQAAQLGLPPTAHAISGNDARAENLFLEPGGASLEEAMAAVDGGVWISWLESPECLDPRRLLFRARARGVRRLRDGRLAEPLPDLVWEDSLARLLSERPLLTRETARRASRDLFVGGIVAPALAVQTAAGAFTHA